MPPKSRPEVCLSLRAMWFTFVIIVAGVLGAKGVVFQNLKHYPIPGNQHQSTGIVQGLYDERSPALMLGQGPQVLSLLRRHHGGSVRQLAGSAPMRSPRSARLFIVSAMNTPGFGGSQSPGMAATRISMVTPCLSRAISDIV